MAAVAVAVRNKRKRQNLQKELEQQQQIQQDSISRANSIDTEPEILKDPSKVGLGRPPRPRRPGGQGLPDDPRRRSKLDKAENEEGVYQASGSANIILYVGLGMICIGLVITFVGLGEKGFRTLELKLIGPSLVGCGVFFALLRVLFCTIPSCCRACCKCCRKQEDTEELIYATVDDPPPKTGYVMGNSTNMSATYTDGRRVGPSNGAQKSAKSARKRSGRANNDPEEAIVDSGDFQNKTIKNVKSAKGSKGNGSGGSGGAKPISYDTYSTDTSSQFSVDIVEVAPRSLELEEASKKEVEQNGDAGKENEIVLNASRLQVESEK